MIKALESNLLNSLDIEMLKLVDKYGYIGIAVSCLDPDVERSIYWSTRLENFICGEPDEKDSRDEYGSVGIWAVIHKLDKIYKKKSGKSLSGGCGNTHQYQLAYENPLSKISYKKIDGVWYLKNIEKLTSEMSNKFGI